MADLIRAGDIVTVRIRVTEVADYGEEGQQVMGQVLPRGGQVGWLVPQEAKVTLDEQQFRKGDFVWVDDARSNKAEVMAVFEHEGTHQLWIKPNGHWKMDTMTVTSTTRRA